MVFKRAELSAYVPPGTGLAPASPETRFAVVGGGCFPRSIRGPFDEDSPHPTCSSGGLILVQYPPPSKGWGPFCDMWSFVQGKGGAVDPEQLAAFVKCGWFRHIPGFPPLEKGGAEVRVVAFCHHGKDVVALHATWHPSGLGGGIGAGWVFTAYPIVYPDTQAPDKTMWRPPLILC